MSNERELSRIRSALMACETYFEGRADAEYFPDSAGPVGNEEMQLLVEVQEAMRRLERASA